MPQAMPPEIQTAAVDGCEDLKQALYHELESQFASRLTEDTQLTPTVRTALISLLGTPAATSSDILAALVDENSKEQEVRGE